MNFSELEQLMSSRGITTLAEISRTLSTTPQAVSNWKARNQVPYHIVATLTKTTQHIERLESTAQSPISATHYASPSIYEEDTISLSDIFLTLAEQLKLIFITTFIAVFLTFTYVQFLRTPQYESWATILLPENKTGNLGGLAGLASQFGVNVPSGSQVDLSSPSLFPELLQSRTFAEKILYKKFYTKEFGKKLPLLAILTYGDGSPKVEENRLVTQALGSLGEILEFKQNPSSKFSVIKITTSEPVFAKELAEVVLAELEFLNRYFKSQAVNEKITFINQRIASVEKDLGASEQALKAFNEQNRQISSPALELEQERLDRDVEVQKGIFLTLKQQLELSKIEEVQEASVVQILDYPKIAISPSNKNIFINVLASFFIGAGLGVFFGFIRSYFDNDDMDERKKLRRVKSFFKKKIKDLFKDKRIAGIISGFMLIGLPLFLGYQSSNPIFFGMYSLKLMIVNTFYVLFLIFTVSLFFYLSRNKKNEKIKNE